MKITATLILFLCFSLISRAQLVLFSENFDDMPGYSIAGWGNTYTGAVPWQSGPPAQVGGCLLPIGGPMSYELGTNKVAAIADCGLMFNYDNSDVLTWTPAINLTGVNGAWLQYDSYFNKINSAGDTEKATVEISVDSGATWSVLQDVPASIPAANFKTYYIDLAAYNNVPDIRIAFRYSDGGGWLQGWAIDNVQVFVPARKDLKLLSVTPIDPLLSYVTAGYAYDHNVQVFNAGLDTIHSFSLNYIQAGGTIKRDTVTGVTLLPFSTTIFTHNIPDTVLTQGDLPVTMWVTLDSDAYHYNDTVRTTLRGAAFIPLKKLALESGEGTWHSWVPRNMTYLASVPGMDIVSCRISVHDGDPMMDTAYSNFLFNLGYNYVPYILFDRRVSVPLDSFYEYLNVQKDYFGYANLDLDAEISGASLIVNAYVKPAIELDGDYRIALVVTEDNVTGTDTGYAQANVYAGGGLGVMGGFETRPNPVPAAQMSYNFVAREIYPDPEGQEGCLPSSMPVGETYTCALSAPLDPQWNTANLHATVLLIRHSDSVILNSNEIPFSLATPGTVRSMMDASVYPDPANETTHVRFDLTAAATGRITIADMSGRTLYQLPATSFNTGRNEFTLPLHDLANGIYLVQIATDQGEKTLKLEVLH